jgi:hypothetical protein
MYIIYDVDEILMPDLPNGVKLLGLNINNRKIYKLQDGYEIPTGAREATIEETKPSKEMSAHLKATIELAADEFHERFIDCLTPRRDIRFAENKAMAAEYLTGNADAQTVAALQVQANAINARDNSELSLTDFCNYILSWKPLCRRIAGEIEAYLVTAKSSVDTLPNLIDVEVQNTLLSNLRNGAESKYIEITTLFQ